MCVCMYVYVCACFITKKVDKIILYLLSIKSSKIYHIILRATPPCGLSKLVSTQSQKALSNLFYLWWLSLKIK